MNLLKLGFICILISMLTFPEGKAQEIKSGRVEFRLNNIPDGSGDKLPDKEPPAVEIIAPFDRSGDMYISFVEEINLIGQVRDRSGISFVSINSKMTELNENGIFSSPIRLQPGLNTISLVAMDDKRNLTEQTVSVLYTIPVLSLAERIRQESKFYALIIGVDHYNDPDLPDLNNPINDAEKLYNTLTSYYNFDKENVRILKDATRGDIIRNLDELAQIVTNNDNLLIFYAGHGWWDEVSTNGYWLPSDAERNVKTNWFRNSALVDYLKEINTRHTLLISDACFAGSIFKQRSAFGNKETAFEKLYDLPSRKAMTSGTLTEVSDRSAFMKYMIERLEENDQVYLSSEQLFSSFRIAVMNNSDAVPQYGEISNVGDQGGDFIFLKKKE